VGGFFDCGQKYTVFEYGPEASIVTAVPGKFAIFIDGYIGGSGSLFGDRSGVPVVVCREVVVAV